MKTHSRIKLALNKPLAWITCGFVAGGIYFSGFTQPSLAQLEVDSASPESQNLIGPRNNRQLRNNRQPAVDTADYEIKGEELRRCTFNASKNKKDCNPIASGYAQIILIANQLYGQGNLAGAEAVFRQLTVSHPKEATPYYKLGIILERQGKADEAITQYRRTIEINSKHALAHNSLAIALARQGQLQDAIGEWQQALQINSEYADAWTNLGLALWQQGQKSEGLDNLKKAKELYLKQNDTLKANQIDQIMKELNSQTT